MNRVRPSLMRPMDRAVYAPQRLNHARQREQRDSLLAQRRAVSSIRPEKQNGLTRTLPR